MAALPGALFAVELHGGVGLYRLAVKWGWFEGDNPKRTRKLLERLKWGITVFFLVLGFLDLAKCAALVPTTRPNTELKIAHKRVDPIWEYDRQPIR